MGLFGVRPLEGNSNPSDTKLGRQLEAVHLELEALNQRRIAIYKRSLEAELDEKAAADFVSNGMLNGPLSEANKENYPMQVNGINWVPDNPPVLALGVVEWCTVQMHGEEFKHLAVLCGEVASAVKAQLADGALLHLSHEQHVALLFVPYLGRFVTAFECTWNRIGTLEALEIFDPGEEAQDNPWYSLAFQMVGVLEIETAKTEKKATDADLH